jgi:NADH-quinone oxidoreductase subunit H
MDQLMAFAWQFILPLAILNIFIAGIWQFMPPGILRWLVCATFIAIPCTVLSRSLRKKRKFEIRTYSFAE